MTILAIAAIIGVPTFALTAFVFITDGIPAARERDAGRHLRLGDPR